MLTSEFVPKTELPTRVKQLLTINYQLKSYDKVISLADTAQKGAMRTRRSRRWSARRTT